MSFSPTHSRYLNFNTASFVEGSSSIGPTGLDILLSNQEWLYHGINSQTLVNIATDDPGYPGLRILISQSNTPTLIGSYGPLKLNLNKLGYPQPIFIAYAPYTYDTTLPGTNPIRGYYTFVFSNNKNIDYNNGFLYLTSSTQTDAFNGASTTAYQTLSGSYYDLESNINFSSTSSISSLPINSLTQFASRFSQFNCMCTLNVYFTMTSGSTSTTYGNISRLFVREVNPYL